MSYAAEPLRDVVAPLVSEADLDLEELTVTPADGIRTVSVVVDSDNGVDLDTCAELSQRLSNALDDAGVLGEGRYDLQVSSPGAERELTAPRHWRRAIGHLAHLVLDDGTRLTARIADVGDTTAVVDVERAPAKKGGKPPAPVRHHIDLADVWSAAVQAELRSTHAGPGED